MLFAGAAELRNDGERANFHERVGQQIKEYRGVSRACADFRVAREIRYGGKSDQDAARVGDGAVGEEALDVGLEQGAKISCKHGESGKNPEGREQELRGG